MAQTISSTRVDTVQHGCHYAIHLVCALPQNWGCIASIYLFVYLFVYFIGRLKNASFRGNTSWSLTTVNNEFLLAVTAYIDLSRLTHSRLSFQGHGQETPPLSLLLYLSALFAFKMAFFRISWFPELVRSYEECWTEEANTWRECKDLFDCWWWDCMESWDQEVFHCCSFVNILVDVLRVSQIRMAVCTFSSHYLIFT